MRVSKAQLIAAVVGLVFGVAWLVVMRGLLAYPDPVHYHANFAVFVNGQREVFDGFGYYEEVQACTQDHLADPHGRVHLHQPSNDVVHVHDHATTWGNLFENLGLVLADNVVTISRGTFVDGLNGRLSFVFNGQRVNSVANQVIGNEDRLLISFGDPDSTPGEYDQIAVSAAEFNTQADPAACSGASQPSLIDRFKHALFE